MARSIKPIVAILMIALFEAVGTGLIIPILPSLIARVVGVDAALQSVLYGLVLSSSLVTMFLFSQLLGRVSDRFGRRPLLLLTLGCTIAVYLVMSVADSVWILLLAQAIAGFCAASGGVGRAYIAEITSPDHRAQSYGIITGAVAFGFITGPVLGGYLGRIDLHLPFYVAAAMTSATLLFALFALPESLDPEDRRAFSWRAAIPFGSLPTLLGTGALARGVLVASLIEAFAVNVPSETGALVLLMQNSLHWGVSQVGLWLTLMGAGTALGQGLMTPIVIRLFGDRNAWLVGIFATVVVFAAAGFITTGWQMYALIGAYALVSFVGPVALALVSRAIAGNQLGEVHGAFISLSSLIKGLAIATGAWVYGYFAGPQTPLHVAGAVFFLGALLQVPAVIYGVLALARNPDGAAADSPWAGSGVAIGQSIQ